MLLASELYEIGLADPKKTAILAIRSSFAEPSEPTDLLAYAGIDRHAIVTAADRLLGLSEQDRPNGNPGE